MTEATLMRRSGAESLQTLEAFELRGSERAGRILRLEGLDTLRALRSLDVASNALTSLAPLAQLPMLTTLDASGNQLASLEGLQHLCGTLRDLDLTANAIAQLPGWLGGMRRLEWLGLAHNRLAELSEFGASLRPLPQLARLGIAGNPLAALPQARLFVVNCCRGLHQIDERPVGIEDVREAAARFDATRADELAAEIASCYSELAEARAHASAETRAKEKAEPVLALERPDAKAMLAGRSTDLAEYQAKALISAYGIPVTREVLAKDRAAAVAAAKEIGFPVVMKVQSAGIAHKTEAGGVRIGVPDAAAVEAAFDAIVASAKAYAPEAVIDGVSVQEMVSGGTELIVGVHNDPLFGPAVMVGLGGIYAEVFKDVSFRLAPLTRSVAESMLHDLKCFPLLDGARGRPKADVEAVVDVLLKLSALSIDLKQELAELDINPLVVLEQGRGVRALDALAKPHVAS
jgi:hypothetical protein